MNIFIFYFSRIEIVKKSRSIAAVPLTFDVTTNTKQNNGENDKDEEKQHRQSEISSLTGRQKNQKIEDTQHILLFETKHCSDIIIRKEQYKMKHFCEVLFTFHLNSFFCVKL